MKLTQLQPDIERMVDGLLGHVWPGGHKMPPVLDEIERGPRQPDFAWRNGRAVPVVKESLTTDGASP